ncbi:SDR family NAD(P)-dependent oxidoreductase [Fodinicurvata fenggangensis]|uniref:SDR family NAD(P)-dependent oxidoreductase n=1 Tax=Fodinicurvata fenggangensis TaxID=1121830 RepID=UPI000555A1B2|nr:SDR family NAD(P)-dependent oxidoreductase [Fodinicurvata fenggangensis]
MKELPSGLNLEGKQIVITGAAGGIGAAVARLSAQLGADLVLTDRGGLEPLKEELEAQGTRVRAQACDISDRRSVEQLIGEAGRIDGLVALAAMCPWDDWMEDGWDAVFDEVMQTNVLSVIHCARACLPVMQEQKDGRMVIVSSVAGRMGGLNASPHYVASKGGVNTLVKWLARRASPHGVLVNGVAPGATSSPMTHGQDFDLSRIPLGRMADPEEIAWPIVFLLTGAASYMSGTILDVNGGVFMN